MLDTIMVLLKELEDGKPHMPPTMLFNEGWLLRVILHWFSQNNVSDRPLSFSPGAVWFSEGLLASQFLPVRRGDELAELYTHADGIIGNIEAGGRGKADIQLVAPGSQIKNEASFKKYMQKELVHQKVRQRVETYKGRSDYEDKRKWFEEYFEPLLNRIAVSFTGTSKNSLPG